MIIKTTNGHGELVRPIRTHEDGTRYATVRTDSGAWVSGRVIRVWKDCSAAMRDHYGPEERR